jgi:hypothetical protein
VQRGLILAMITRCQSRLHVKLRTPRILQYSKALRDRRIDIIRQLHSQDSSNSFRIDQTGPCSCSALSSSSVNRQRRHSSSNGYEKVPKGDSTKIFPSSSKKSEDEKNQKGNKHKPLLVSHSNSTRLRNDKIRQLQQQGEDDRQQSEAMMATSVSHQEREQPCELHLNATSYKLCYDSRIKWSLLLFLFLFFSI